MLGLKDVIAEVSERAYKSKEFCLGGVEYHPNPKGDTLLLSFILKEDGTTKFTVRLDNVFPERSLLDELVSEIGYEVVKFNLHTITAEAILVLKKANPDGSTVEKKYKLPGFLSLDKYKKKRH